MIIDLVDNGTSRPTPNVSFDPPGRFTAGMMLDYLPFFANAIERAQAQVRHAQERTRGERGPIQTPEPIDPDPLDNDDESVAVLTAAAPVAARRRVPR
jgi:hypothetical protein